MARLPEPGGDSGKWGEVLNHYLLQSHKADGTLKENSVNSSVLANNSVTSSHLTNKSVGSDHLADSSIKPIHITNKSVNSGHLADGSVGSAHIAPGSIGSAHIADGSVKSNHLTPGSVGSDQIANGSIGTNHLAENSVPESKLSNEVKEKLNSTGGQSPADSPLRNVMNPGGEVTTYIEIVSDTEPPKTAEWGGKTYPVSWVRLHKLTVPAAPVEPLWDLPKYSVAVPALTGVDYIITSVTDGGTTRPVNHKLTGDGGMLNLRDTFNTSKTFDVVITAAAQPGYRIFGDFEWRQSFIDRSQMVILASTGFDEDSDMSKPTPLDYNAGGSRRNLGWSIANVDQITFRQMDGHFRVPTDEEAKVLGITKFGNSFPHIELYGLVNMQVEFDIVDIGTGSGNIFGVYLDGRGVVFFTAQRASAVESAGNNSPGVPVTDGRWTIRLFDDLLTVISPTGESFESTNLQKHDWLKGRLAFRCYANTRGTTIDNLVVYGA